MRQQGQPTSSNRTAALPLTPDFYEYERHPVSRLVIDDRFLTITWPDGVTLRAFDLWLIENVVGYGVDSATREGLLDPADHDMSMRIASAEATADGNVRLSFASGLGATATAVEGTFHSGWLRHVAQELHVATSWLPAQRSWSAEDMGAPPTHDGVAVLTSDAAFAAWLNDLASVGLARLRGLPDDPDIALQLAAKIGAVRDTNFGRIWDVKADVTLAGAADTNSTANTNLRLGPHTDLPTRETPPGYQFLHCYVNEAEGGYSTMADGAAVVEALRVEYPHHYEALTTLHWVFFNRGPGIDHRWSGPLIDLGVPGSPLTLRAFYPVRGFPDMAPKDMPRAYEAMQCFSQMAGSDRFQIRYPFEPGDMIGFDNRRILHGRDRFSAGGRRHLRGIYIDHDEILSATRVANRTISTGTKES